MAFNPRMLTILFLFSAYSYFFYSVTYGYQTTNLANGVKIGEVTDHSVLIWTRITQYSSAIDGKKKKAGRRNPVKGVLLPGNGAKKVGDWDYRVPGAKGKVQIQYWPKGKPAKEEVTEWKISDSKTDFTNQFYIKDLNSNTSYDFRVIVEVGGNKVSSITGFFKTAPGLEELKTVRFGVLTGQAFSRLEKEPLKTGFEVYRSMLKDDLDFLVLTGDAVYFDRDEPMAKSVDVARYHWNRMYSLSDLINFHRQIPGYWLKDDHDIVVDDADPSRPGKSKFGKLTFAQGLNLFYEQTPNYRGKHPETKKVAKPYRSFRWGKRVEVFFPEVREFRNTTQKGPPTIWGEEQKKWFKEALLNSEAHWLLVVTPTPILGPDRISKKDNHANFYFKKESLWIRNFLNDEIIDKGKKVLLLSGDRHWQYHSYHPKFNLNEFSGGPVTDAHAGGFPGKRPLHQWYKVKGGYLYAEIGPDTKNTKKSKVRIELRSPQGYSRYTWNSDHWDPPKVSPEDYYKYDFNWSDDKKNNIQKPESH